MARARPRGFPRRYGIGEWFGRSIETLTDQERQTYALAAARAGGVPIPDCPFMTQFAGTPIKCPKKGGVCSFAVFEQRDEGAALIGNKACACPSRFYEHSIVFRTIGQHILGTENVGLAKEVDFLTSTVTGEAAGSIDWVLFNREDRKDWCALEFQAVYFSGGSMSHDFTAYRDAEGLVFPVKQRRPDFRSSAPKRLMPQLMIKVPTLRRWGKRTAVVVDEAFFAAMGSVRTVEHISNCDIVWFVVSYDEQSKLQIRPENIKYSTLEASVEGLTGGVPVPLPIFETRLQLKELLTLTGNGGDPVEVAEAGE